MHGCARRFSSKAICLIHFALSTPRSSINGFWDGHEHVDPAKEANAQKIRLANHTTTLAHEYARQGRDWEAELKQRAKEISLMRELGLSADSTHFLQRCNG